MERQHSSSPHPKKFRAQKSSGNVLTSIFWDQDSILHTDYLPKGQTVNVKYYSSLLVQLKDSLKEEHCGKGNKKFNPAQRRPGSPDTCNPQDTGLPGLPMPSSPTLFSRSGPVELPPAPWTEKTNSEVSIFCFT
jgi:hypothetical protein